MAKIDTFTVKIKTGTQGTNTPPRFRFNSHMVEFSETQGGTQSGEEFIGSFAPRSFLHSMTIVGPEEGTWDIQEIEITYRPDDEEPYSVTFGEATLDETTELDVFRKHPLPVFDV